MNNPIVPKLKGCTIVLFAGAGVLTAAVQY
jgi:hypothetical protein